MITILTGERRRGFHLQFPNGWLISVQIGPGNYHDNRNQPLTNTTSSPNAEIAVWHRDSPMVEWPSGDTVQGWVPTDRIARVIAYIAALPDLPSAWGTGSTVAWLGIIGKEEFLP